jgi:VWFA-related protein
MMFGATFTQLADGKHSPRGFAMSCNPRFSLTFIVAVLVFVNLGFGQQHSAAPLPQPIPDFGRLVDPTSQTSIQFQSYDKNPLTFTSKTIYVLVPVVVTDKDGKPVTGLKKEDFHVQENAKDQAVSSMEEIHATAASLSRSAIPGNEVRNQTSSDATPRRLVIIALDMVNTPFEDQTRARRALISYLSENIDPDSLYQLVAVENNGLRILHDYTEQTAPLVAALKAAGNKFPTVKADAGFIERAGKTEPGPNSGVLTGEDPESGTPFLGPAELRVALETFLAASGTQELQAQQANAANSTLSAFQQIAERASGVPGRKSLVWITGSFPFSIDPASASVSDGTSFETYQHVMQLLDNQLISVYPIDARGLVAAELDATTHISTRQFVMNNNLQRDMSNRLLDTLNTMRAFADMTGGQAYVNNNDTRGAIREAVQDGSAYYMLSYAADKSDRRPGWRKITVKVGDYRVRARHGYFLTQTTLDPLTSAKYDIDSALRSPLDYTGLPVQMVMNPTVVNGNKRKVTFAMTVPPKGARVDSDDKNHMHVEIAYAVWTATGQDAGHKGTRYNLNLNPTQLQQIDTNGLGYGDTLDLAPGSYKLRVVVRDNLTGQIGSVSAPLELK